ncbi:hypothetical protein VP01_3196g2 [Puccinia sorghi]|uniref:Uncharacterized protein n=1 Tax=Puccinia sorghi TaxID=27349 RepID=A0A0L6UYF8_9BASI|nr:hypothetical protein VP01_3196g2 [Puccinia sorghi]
MWSLDGSLAGACCMSTAGILPILVLLCTKIIFLATCFQVSGKPFCHFAPIWCFLLFPGALFINSFGFNGAGLAFFWASRHLTFAPTGVTTVTTCYLLFITFMLLENEVQNICLIQNWERIQFTAWVMMRLTYISRGINYSKIKLLINGSSHCKKTCSNACNLMHIHCAYCTMTVPKHLNMQTGGVWMTAWLENAAYKLQAVDQIHKKLSNIYVLVFLAWIICICLYGPKRFCHVLSISFHLFYFISLIIIVIIQLIESSENICKNIYSDDTAKEKLAQLPAVDMQHDSAKLSFKLHLFTYLDRFDWITIGERLEQLIKFFLQCDTTNGEPQWSLNLLDRRAQACNRLFYFVYKAGVLSPASTTLYIPQSAIYNLDHYILLTLIFIPHYSQPPYLPPPLQLLTWKPASTCKSKLNMYSCQLCHKLLSATWCISTLVKPKSPYDLNYRRFKVGYNLLKFPLIDIKVKKAEVKAELYLYE